MNEILEQFSPRTRNTTLNGLSGRILNQPYPSHSISFTTPLPLAPDGEVPCGATMFFFMVYGPIYGLVCAVGLIGNSLSFAIMHKYSRDNVATYLLKVLAVVDSAFLATGGFIQIFTAMSVHFEFEQLEAIHPYLQVYAWPKVHIVQLGTVWMMVLVAANRYIAVCRPLQAASLCSKRNVTRQMIIILICVILYNLPRYAEYRYVPDTNESPSNNDTNDTTVSYHNVGLAALGWYNILYENIAYGLFAYLIPLTTLIILNLHLVRELNRAKRYRQTMASRSSAEEHNITFVMIIIIVSFIVCETPACVNQILFYLVSEEQRKTCSYYGHFNHISNLLIITNSALNFFIYCLFRRQFQQELRALVCGVSLQDGAIRRTVLLRAMHGGSSEASSTQGSICRAAARNGFIRSGQYSLEYTRGSSLANGSLHSTVSVH